VNSVRYVQGELVSPIVPNSWNVFERTAAIVGCKAIIGTSRNGSHASRNIAGSAIAKRFASN